MKCKNVMTGFLCLTLMIFGCKSTGSQFALDHPEEGKSLLVGAVLVENDGIDDLYQVKLSKILVVIVGKHIENGKEVTKGYRLKTDAEGYFALSNVPEGAYVLKGIEVDVGYTNRLMISSRWEGNSQIYIPAGYMIDYNVRFWPDEMKGKVLDMGIHYFKLDNARRIYHDQFKMLKNARLGLDDVRHTMRQPKIYYKEKYPDFEWFQ